ncbi:MAG: hypothetical protein WDA27_13810 [Actinomycetota bacterium]
MRSRLPLALTVLALTVAPLPGRAAPTLVTQDRSVEPVVLTGAQFPAWSAGPDPTFREPQTPTEYTVFDQHQYLGPLASDCYKSSEHPNPYDYSDNGDHNCVQPSRIPANPNVGADVNRILGYRWDSAAEAFVQIPFQVDERFTRYLTNNASGFAFYSGVDQETTYAWDREGFRYTSDDFIANDGNPCLAKPAPGSEIGPKGFATTADPVKGLDDNDELAFMWSDAGTQAPAGTALPTGIESANEVAVADPSKPENVAFAYVMLAAPDGPAPAYTSENGYVRYQRDANADMFVYSQSSYDGYGAAPKGPYCNPDGSISTTAHDNDYTSPEGIDRPAEWVIEQRRPLDTAWIKTPRYWFRYDGRWLMTQIRVSPDDTGLDAGGNVGPDLIDQWKARAFQQRPGGTTPCCGYEEEVNNWGGSSISMGERWGPVRAIRAAWGADSSTNNVRVETFYRDEFRLSDALRVHVMPPADGVYIQWDYNAGKMTRYYNPFVTEGVDVDGKNDEVFGNTNVHIANDRVEIRDDDPIPVVGPQHHTVPLAGGSDDCEIGVDPASGDGVCNDLDFADPTFSGPTGPLNWEQVGGPFGTLVTRWSIKQHTAGDAYTLITQPYYRDDSCFDDGTGSDPGPHLRSRAPDDGAYGTYTDPSTSESLPRVCWTPEDGDPASNPAGARKFWQGDIATHGMHIQFIADSDNAQMPVPLTEVDSEQRIVILPGLQLNVGDQYGRHVEFPLQALVRPYV